MTRNLVGLVIVLKAVSKGVNLLGTIGDLQAGTWGKDGVILTLEP